jgi:hypothetical protein
MVPAEPRRAPLLEQTCASAPVGRSCRVHRCSRCCSSAERRPSAHWHGLDHPTAIRFAPDGRVFVAQRRCHQAVRWSLGHGPRTRSPICARTCTTSGIEVCWGWRSIPASRPEAVRLRALHLLRSDRRLAADVSDGCPHPPGATADGGLISGRLSQLTALWQRHELSKRVLINNWCQQDPSHSIGSLGFGADGKLYVWGGNGASFNSTDYGQDGSPLKSLRDPPRGLEQHVPRDLRPPRAGRARRAGGGRAPRSRARSRTARLREQQALEKLGLGLVVRAGDLDQVALREHRLDLARRPGARGDRLRGDARLGQPDRARRCGPADRRRAHGSPGA